MNKEIKICFMGTPRFGEIVLQKLIEDYTVVLVVTQPDKPGKRGKGLVEPPVKILAEKNGIPVFQPDSIKTDFSKMTEYSFDFLITAAYGQFIPLDVLHLPKIMTLNVHGSLLPKYRGGAPIQRAIENGDKYLGVSIMRTIMKMDAGVVYKQEKVECGPLDTFGTMSEKLANTGSRLLLEVIEDMYGGLPISQTHQDVNEVTFAYNIEKEEEKLDFSEEAVKLVNKIRAFNPSPLTYFIKDNVSYKVYEAYVAMGMAKPGEILANDKELLIGAGKDLIGINIIQAPGKKPMDIQSFLNGNRMSFKVGDKVE